jgi:hypothetical protein
MNNEQQQIIDEVFENYWDINPDADKTFQYEGHTIETRRMTKDEFVFMVKTDPEFSERWGLKVDERELSLEERIIFAGYDYENRGGIGWNMLKESVDLDNSIPIKLITITYNDKTIESYE